MPNENDSKLVTLADLSVAYNNLDTNKKSLQTAVSSPTTDGTSISFIDSISQNAQGVIAPTKKSIPEATTSSAGLMSSTDKTKLNEIETGAQVNTVTSVNNKTGAVNLTPSDIGALPDTTTAADIGAMSKAGDTMTGRLTINPSSPSNRLIVFSSVETGGFLHLDSSGRFRFMQRSPDGTKYERFWLPLTDNNANNLDYDILTTKDIDMLTTGNFTKTETNTNPNISNCNTAAINYYKTLRTCTVEITFAGVADENKNKWTEICSGLPKALSTFYFLIYGYDGVCSVAINNGGTLSFHGRNSQNRVLASAITYVTAE